MQRRNRNRLLRPHASKLSRPGRRPSLRGMERLESRRMLSADFGADLLRPEIGTPDKPIEPPSEIRVEQQMQAAADAGETLATAWDLGELNEPLALNGYVGWWDARDLYRFSLSREAEIDLRLEQLVADVDLSLHDVSGRRLAASTLGGNSPEQLQGTLAAGTYYVNIEPWGWADSTYRVSLDAQLTAPPIPEPEDTVSPLPDAPAYGGANEWNLNAMAAPEAWQAGYTGQGVTVAVVDTGLDLDHPDVAGSLWTNPGEIPGNGIDDDGNGYADDHHGWNFHDQNNTPEDGNGHGTHVAGTVVAGRNGFGATGVASNVQLMPVRVLGDGGSGSVSSVAAGIRYAADNGAEIINLSLGGGYSREIAAAIEYAGGLGSLVVTAAGNEGASEPSYPARHSASMSHVISVGAHDAGAALASFSNRVGASGAVQVDAPGSSIFSTYAGGLFARLSGTSMAAPHVTGLAALALGASPESIQLTSAGLRELVVAGADRTIVGSDATGGINAAMTVAMAAAGVTGSNAETAASTTTAAAPVYGTYTQSLTAIGLPTLAPEPGVQRAESASDLQRTDKPKALNPQSASARSRTDMSETVTRQADQHDAALLEAMESNEEQSLDATPESATEPQTAAWWQQSVDDLLKAT